MNKLQSYQKEFIKFLLEEKALTFGDFTTKSGRKTPYFINTGNFNTGLSLSKLGQFYADHVVAQGTEFDTIFGPAYKGISLAVATGIALSNKYNKVYGISFNRKEAKEHGDKGNIVGKQLASGEKVILVEDVVTAGTTLREVIPVLRNDYKVEVSGVFIAVDRAEKGTGSLSAVQEAKNSLNLSISPIVTVHDLIAFLSETNLSSYNLPSDLITRMNNYIETYGA
jgi:orotate phosphoribosyltransferase